MEIRYNQEVFLVGIGNNARYDTPTQKVRVDKVGRKWFTVDTGDYIGNSEKFSLEDGKCDGKGYMPEWQIFQSEQEYKESREKPKLKNEIERSLKELTYKQLDQILKFIKEV